MMYHSFNVDQAYCSDYSANGYATPSERNVARIVTELETLQSREPRFQVDLSRWQCQRRKTLAALDELREKLQNVSLCANVARGAGSAAIIAGGLASLIGVIMEINEAKDSPQWLDAGEGLRKLGEMTVPVATLLELGVSEMFMNRVKSVLQKDQEYARPLEQWMLTSRNLDAHIRETFGCSITSDALTSVLSTFCSSLRMMGSGRESDAYQNLKGSRTTSYQKFANFAEDLRDTSMQDLLGLVQRVYTFCQDSPHTFRLCQTGVELGAAIYGQTAPVNLMPVMSVANAGMRMVGLNRQERRCGLEAVRIASEVVSIVSTAQNIIEHKSEYCAQLDELKSKLTVELVEVSRASRSFQ